jgi:hypothetical protein
MTFHAKRRCSDEQADSNAHSQTCRRNGLQHQDKDSEHADQISTGELGGNLHRRQSQRHEYGRAKHQEGIGTPSPT